MESKSIPRHNQFRIPSPNPATKQQTRDSHPPRRARAICNPVSGLRVTCPNFSSDWLVLAAFPRQRVSPESLAWLGLSPTKEQRLVMKERTRVLTTVFSEKTRRPLRPGAASTPRRSAGYSSRIKRAWHREPGKGVAGGKISSSRR